tara:strand:- start:365 stop:769 length:405 start_codon:yes stop_codon:yes gene_type:complete
MYKQYKVTIVHNKVTEHDIIVQSEKELTPEEIKEYAFFKEVRDQLIKEQAPEMERHYRPRYEKKIYEKDGIKIKDDIPIKTIKSESTEKIYEVITGKQDLRTSQEHLDWWKIFNKKQETLDKKRLQNKKIKIVK